MKNFFKLPQLFILPTLFIYRQRSLVHLLRAFSFFKGLQKDPSRISEASDHWRTVEILSPRTAQFALLATLLFTATDDLQVSRFHNPAWLWMISKTPTLFSEIIKIRIRSNTFNSCASWLRPLFYTWSFACDSFRMRWLFAFGTRESAKFSSAVSFNGRWNIESTYHGSRICKSNLNVQLSFKNPAL